MNTKKSKSAIPQYKIIRWEADQIVGEVGVRNIVTLARTELDHRPIRNAILTRLLEFPI